MMAKFKYFNDSRGDIMFHPACNVHGVKGDFSTLKNKEIRTFEYDDGETLTVKTWGDMLLLSVNF